MSKPTDRPEVRIGGVLYVPVSEAHITVQAIEDAVVGQWGGDNWRTDYPDTPAFLRVIVTDDAGADEGETVSEFVARLLAAAERGGPNATQT